MTEERQPQVEADMIRRATVKVNGLSLFYLDTGAPGEPMLCLHGRWGRAGDNLNLAIGAG
jgi:hypothetical protein